MLHHSPKVCHWGFRENVGVQWVKCKVITHSEGQKGTKKCQQASIQSIRPESTASSMYK